MSAPASGTLENVSGGFDVLRYFPLCPPPVPSHVDQVAGILEKSLQECEGLVIDRLVLLSRPDLLWSLWRTHKQRFLREGRFERAFRAQLVLEALRRAAPGSLAVARARLGNTSFVAWIDLSKNALVSLLEDDDGVLTDTEVEADAGDASRVPDRAVQERTASA